MKRSHLLLLSVCALLASCKNDEPAAQKETVFTLSLAGNVDMGGSQSFVIIRKSSTSELIDYKEIKQGTTVNFETDKLADGENLDVIYFSTVSKVVPGPNNTNVTQTHHYVNAYQNVPPGSEWSWKAPVEPVINTVANGVYSVTVADVPSNYSIIFSDKFGGVGSPEFNSGTVQIQLPPRSGATKELLSIHNVDADPKYTWITDPKNGDQFNLKYSELKNFDKVIDFHPPQAQPVQATVIGTTELPPAAGIYTYNIPGYILIGESNGMPLSSLKLGFLNEIPVYAINLSSFNTSSEGFLHTSVGPVPNAINYVDPSVVNISDRSLSNFTYATSIQSVLMVNARYERVVVSASTSERTDVVVHAGEGDKMRNPMLPDELLTQFNVPLDQVKFNYAEFVVEGDVYTDFLKRNKVALGGDTYQPDPPFVEQKLIVR